MLDCLVCKTTLEISTQEKPKTTVCCDHCGSEFSLEQGDPANVLHLLPQDWGE